MDNNDAEILDADIIDVPGSDYNPNQTQQVVNLVQISPTVNIGSPPPKNSKLQKETIRSILKLYQSISEESGFKVEFDIENIQANFEQIIPDENEEFFRIVISKAFGKFQLVFYQRAMNSIMTLMDQISSPEVINDKTISIEWKYGMINQLLGLMGTVSDLYERVKVEHPELIIRNLVNQSKGQDGDLKDIQLDKNTIAVMKQLKSISLRYKDKDKDK